VITIMIIIITRDVPVFGSGSCSPANRLIFHNRHRLRLRPKNAGFQ
jgi:hypothetical protein